MSFIMDEIREAILRGAAGLPAASVARADAAICRKLAREVEDAYRVVNAVAMWNPSFPGLPTQRLSAAEATDAWKYLANDARRTIAAAILATESYEGAVDLILDSTPGSRDRPL